MIRVELFLASGQEKIQQKKFNLADLAFIVVDNRRRKLGFGFRRITPPSIGSD
jgi:hypothetical protein